MNKQKILITGGCGKIGSHFAKFAANQFDLRLVDKADWDEAKHGAIQAEIIQLDLQQMSHCQQACAGIDTVIHLAADGNPEADFHDSLLGNNILATRNLFLAATEAGCRRFIFASSAHVFSGYPAERQLTSETAVNPGNEYGVSKCYGEALAAYVAHAHQLSTIVLRIGAYLFPEEYAAYPPDQADAFLHPDDFNHLLTQSIKTPNIPFLIAHAVSDNRHKRLDLTETKRRLGYLPKADGFQILGN